MDAMAKIDFHERPHFLMSRLSFSLKSVNEFRTHKGISPLHYYRVYRLSERIRRMNMFSSEYNILAFLDSLNSS